MLLIDQSFHAFKKMTFDSNHDTTKTHHPKIFLTLRL